MTPASTVTAVEREPYWLPAGAELPYWAPSEPCAWDTVTTTLDALRVRIAAAMAVAEQCPERTDVSKRDDQKRIDSYLASLETSVKKGEAERKEREAREAYDQAVAARREAKRAQDVYDQALKAQIQDQVTKAQQEADKKK